MPEWICEISASGWFYYKDISKKSTFEYTLKSVRPTISLIRLGFV